MAFNLLAGAAWPRANTVLILLLLSPSLEFPSLSLLSMISESPSQSLQIFPLLFSQPLENWNALVIPTLCMMEEQRAGWLTHQAYVRYHFKNSVGKRESSRNSSDIDAMPLTSPTSDLDLTPGQMQLGDFSWTGFLLKVFMFAWKICSQEGPSAELLTKAWEWGSSRLFSWG